MHRCAETAFRLRRLDYGQGAFKGNREEHKQYATGSEIGLFHDFLGMENRASPLFGPMYGELTIAPFSRSMARRFLAAGSEVLEIKITEEEMERGISLAGRHTGLTDGVWIQPPSHPQFREKHAQNLEKAGGSESRIEEAEDIASFSGPSQWSSTDGRKMSWIKFENGRYRIIDPVVEKVIKERF